MKALGFLLVLMNTVQRVDGQGHDGATQYTYVLAVPQIDMSNINQDPFIAITNVGRGNATVCVYLPDGVRDVHWDIPAGETGVISGDMLPPIVQATIDNARPAKNPLDGGKYGNKKIVVNSTGLLTVVAGSSSADAFFVLPVTSLGTRYYAMTGQGLCRGNKHRRNQILVVNGGDYEMNVVNMTIVETGPRSEVTPMQITLNRAQSTWIYTSDCDLTGSTIESEYPVAVITGRQRAPFEDDFEAEMMPPVASWGTVFPIPYRAAYAQQLEVIRILAAEDNTSYSFHKGKSGTLHAGESADVFVDKVRVLDTTKPVLVMLIHSFDLKCYESGSNQYKPATKSTTVTTTSQVDIGWIDPTELSIDQPGAGGPALERVRRQTSPSGVFTLIPPVEQYANMTVLLTGSPYVNRTDMNHYWGLFAPQELDPGYGAPSCHWMNGTNELQALESANASDYVLWTFGLDRNASVECIGSNFSVIAYGVGESGSGSYAYAHCLWTSSAESTTSLAPSTTAMASLIPVTKTSSAPSTSSSLEPVTTTSGTSTTPSLAPVWPTSTEAASVTSTTTSLTISSTPMPSSPSTTSTFSTPSSSNLTKELEAIEHIAVTDPDTADRVLEKLDDVLGDNKTLDEQDIRLAVASLVKCAKVEGLNSTSFEHYVSVMDAILEQDETTLMNSNSSAKLLEAIPQLASHTLDDGKLFKETDNMAMMIRTQPCTKDKGLGLVQFRNGSAADISLYPDEAVLREALAFLYLPLDGNCPSGRAKRDTTTIDTVKTSFVVYKTQKLFRAAPPTPGSDESDDSEEECCKVKDWPQTNFVVEADILTKQLERMDITSHNLTNPVSIGFYVENGSRPLLHAQSLCTFWNRNRWSPRGCRLVESKQNMHICQCDHLTDFTLLIKTSSRDPALCGPLLVLTAVLTAISMISLFLALVLFVASRYLRRCFAPTSTIRPGFLQALARTPPPRQNRSSLSEPLMATMFTFLVLFALLSDQKRLGMSNYGCQVAAAILYSVLLAQLCWATLAGIGFFKTYYIVFDENISRAMTKRKVGLVASVVIPSFTTVLLWKTRNDFFQRDDEMCWVRPDYVGMAVMLPLSLLILGDVVLTLLLVKSFFCTKSMAKGKRKTTLMLQKCMVLMTVQVILAFPWIFQYFTIGSPEATPFSYLFCIAFGAHGAILAGLYVFAYARWVQRTRTQGGSSTKTAITQATPKWSRRLRKISPWSASSTEVTLTMRQGPAAARPEEPE